MFFSRKSTAQTGHVIIIKGLQCGSMAAQETADNEHASFQCADKMPAVVPPSLAPVNRNVRGIHSGAYMFMLFGNSPLKLRGRQQKQPASTAKSRARKVQSDSERRTTVHSLTGLLRDPCKPAAVGPSSFPLTIFQDIQTLSQKPFQIRGDIYLLMLIVLHEKAFDLNDL